MSFMTLRAQPTPTTTHPPSSSRCIAHWGELEEKLRFDRTHARATHNTVTENLRSDGWGMAHWKPYEGDGAMW